MNPRNIGGLESRKPAERLLLLMLSSAATVAERSHDSGRHQCLRLPSLLVPMERSLLKRKLSQPDDESIGGERQ
jgi:hypothetical protein